MDLILFRHGIAEDAAPDSDDATRKLTREGRDRTAEAAAGLARLIDRPDVILTSPKIRAAQTAKIVAAAFEKSIEPQTLPALAGASANRLAHQLSRRSESLVIAVGHEPTLSQAAELLTAGTHTAGFIQLKKAGCICLEIDPPNAPARIKWIATPKMLRLIGK